MQSLKSLLVTLIILGGAFLAYDYYLAPPIDKMVFKTSPYPKSFGATPEALAAAPAEEAPAPGPSAMAQRAPTTTPATTVATLAPPTSSKPASSAMDAGFAPPPIPDVVKATANWTNIPATAFPRPVKLLSEAEFKGQYGATKMAAGSAVTVLASKNGLVQIAPNAQSPLRAVVSIDATDLKQILTVAYDAWRAKRVAEAELAAKSRPAPSADTSTMVAADGKPEQAVDGTYPLLVQSMAAGQVTEVTPTSVRRWGKPEPGNYKGKPSWIVAVEYDAQTAFGRISSEAQAQVVEGRVAGWFYKGSGEPVP